MISILECKLEAMLCLIPNNSESAEPKMCGRTFVKCIEDATGKEKYICIGMMLLFYSGFQIGMFLPYFWKWVFKNPFKNSLFIYLVEVWF